MLFDLAGSENTSDSKFHDKEMQKQSKEINKSLMNLKECIRNRALQAMNPGQKYHIPYRASKLTLVLKNSFELSSRIHCKTVVFANVSSAVIDHVQTKNFEICHSNQDWFQRKSEEQELAARREESCLLGQPNARRIFEQVLEKQN